ncbi:MAG: 3-dehydroquinate synthase [Ilumatobacteraceae bacterium]|nr:3-dehydroquinate synthase [Ilumatobacteraceae bacterium]
MHVDLGTRSYPVVVGHGVVGEIDSLLPKTAKRAVIVTQKEIGFVVKPKIDSTTVLIGNGEQHKNLQTIEMLSQKFAEIGLTRNDVVIGLGGGMVTDVAGFAAASWHRGTPVLHVSTSLVGMVDAAIGGKTGVNIDQGKNLVGAFWQPCAVVCDLDALKTLPEREMRCGLGEVAKYHFLTGDDLLALEMPQRIARCVEIKAKIVAADERESGGRALLNYGHTLAHALERSSNFSLAHGEAVAVGMIYAAHLAHAMQRISQARVEEHYKVIGQTYGLKVKPDERVNRKELIELMRHDKKAVSGLTFVLDGASGIEVVSGVSEKHLEQAFDAMQLSEK